MRCIQIRRVWRGELHEMLGRKERRWPELFAAGSPRDVLPDDHVLVRGDRVLSFTRPIGVDGGRQALAAVGSALLVLPPYSPDLNPIAQLLAKLQPRSPRQADVDMAARSPQRLQGQVQAPAILRRAGLGGGSVQHLRLKAGVSGAGAPAGAGPGSRWRGR